MPYSLVKRLECPSHKRILVIEANEVGLFRFVEWEQREEKDFDGGPITFWAPNHWSGLYETVGAAEADAKTTRPWLADMISH